MNDDCLFCNIVEGKVPSWKIYENDSVYAFLDIYPVSHGHTLVIPKKHYKDIHEVPEKNYIEVAIAAKNIAKAVKQATGADGINVTKNNGEAAGQVIPHSHTHIIPRFKDDGLKVWPTTEFSEKDRDSMMEKIKNALK